MLTKRKHQYGAPVELSDGGAAAPALTWILDPDTGFYRKGANEIGVATGGVERGSIDTNGLFRWLGGTILGSATPAALHGASMLGIIPTGDLVSGIVMQAPDDTWGMATDGGEGNADYAKGQFLALYGNPAVGDDSNLDKLRLRINYEGSIGMLGGMHLMYGRNGALTGSGWGQVIWSNPQVDVPHIVLTRQALAAAQPFMLALTEAGATVFRLDADGVMRATFVADIQNLGPYLQFNSNGLLLKNRDAAHVIASLRSISGQTADIFDIQTTDARIFAVSNAALPYTKGASSGFMMYDRDNVAKNFLIYPNAEYLRIFAGADRVSFGRGAAQHGVIVKQFPALTADMMRGEPSGSTTPLWRFNKNGLLILKVSTAPADADVSTSEIALWVQDTIGSTRIKAKQKDSAGTVVNKTLLDDSMFAYGDIVAGGLGGGSAILPLAQMGQVAQKAIALTATGLVYKNPGAARGIRSWIAPGNAATAMIGNGVAAPTASPAGTNVDNDSGPFITAITPAVINNDATLSSPTMVNVRWAPEVSFGVLVPNVITLGRWYIGLVASSPFATGTPVVKMACFRYDTSVDGTVFFRCITADGTAATITTTTIDVVADTTVDLRIEMYNNGTFNVFDPTHVKFYINDALVATHTTNLPGAVNLQIFTGVRTLSAAARRCFSLSRMVAAYG